MIVHLDTSFLVRMHLRGEAEDRCVSGWLGQRCELQTSAVAWCEYVCGPLAASDLRDARELVSAVLPLLQEDAELAAQLFNLGGRRRRSLADCQIAATAIRAGAPLATSNRSDFARFRGAGLRLA